MTTPIVAAVLANDILRGYILTGDGDMSREEFMVELTKKLFSRPPANVMFDEATGRCIRDDVAGSSFDIGVSWGNIYQSVLRGIDLATMELGDGLTEDDFVHESTHPVLEAINEAKRAAGQAR